MTTKTKEMLRIGVGEIPLYDYLKYLDSRCFNWELVKQYTKEIHNTDLTDEDNVYSLWDYFSNTYDKFKNEVQLSRVNDGTREWFQSLGRNRYLKFHRKYKGNEVYDGAICHSLRYSVIHHIHPLVFSGDNSLQNLIPLCDINHDILHLNPKENIKECCHHAVEYLHYLYHGKLDYIFKKYKLDLYEDKKIASEILKIAIKEEMKLFYEKLKENYKGDMLCK